MSEENDEAMTDGNSGTTEQASTSVQRSSPAFVPGKRLLSKTVRERQLKKLSPLHHEIAERLIAGQSPKDIAKEMGIGKPWLSVVMNSPLFIDHLEKRQAQRALLVDFEIVQREWNQAVHDRIREIEKAPIRLLKRYKQDYGIPRSRKERESYEELKGWAREMMQEHRSE